MFYANHYIDYDLGVGNERPLFVYNVFVIKVAKRRILRISGIFRKYFFLILLLGILARKFLHSGHRVLEVSYLRSVITLALPVEELATTVLALESAR